MLLLIITKLRRKESIDVFNYKYIIQDIMRNIDRLFDEYNVTKTEQKQMMDVMDKYRNLIEEA